MQSSSSESMRSYLPSIFTLVILGWGMAGIAIFFMTPTLWARWMLFFGFTLGLTGLALPVTWFLNLRFPTEPPAGPYVSVRQAIWVGVYGALMAWLQQARLVTPWIALGLAAGLIAIEYLVGMRERARHSEIPVQVEAVEEDETETEHDPAVEE